LAATFPAGIHNVEKMLIRNKRCMISPSAVILVAIALCSSIAAYAQATLNADPPTPVLALDPQTKADCKAAAAKWDAVGLLSQLTANSPACLAATFRSAPCLEVMESLALAAEAASMTMTAVAIDSIDTQYTSIAQPVFPPLPSTSKSSAVNALYSNLQQQIGYSRALVVAVNRAQGASAARSHSWFLQQRQAAASYATQLSVLLGTQPALLSALQSESLGVLPSIVINGDQVLAYQRQLAAAGLPPARIAALASLQFSSSEIADVTNRIAAPSVGANAPFVVTGVPIDAALDSITLNLSQLLVQFAGTAAANPQNPRVTVDFGSLVPGVESASGFLLSMDPTTPPDAAITPLKPRFWRYGGYPSQPLLTVLARLRLLGANAQVVVSDFWGYPSNASPWKPPYADWPTYEAFVRQTAGWVNDVNVTYDVWNEPDNAGSWGGTRDQYFQTYLHAYRAIRQQLGPDVLIGGPSIALSYDKTFLSEFLDFCIANGCEVNFLSWHELYDDDDSIEAIFDHLNDARISFKDNPSYSGLRIQKLYVNEAVGPRLKHQPGGILANLYYLEKGATDGAAKSCWPDSSGRTECYDGSLDGLRTASHQPRAAWWAYKTYADGISSRVSTTTSDHRVVALASATSSAPDQAQVLVGYVNSAPPAAARPATVAVALGGLSALPFAQSSAKVHVHVEKIPDTDEGGLASPIPVNDLDVPIVNGTARLDVANIGVGEEYVLTISRSDAQPAASLNFQGLWWAAPGGSEAGWGISFAHQGDVIFASWFTYDVTGKDMWLVMTAPRIGIGVYAGTLLQLAGPAFDAVPFSRLGAPGGAVTSAVGTGTLTFTDANNAAFAYTLNGISQAKAITRQSFGTLPTCTFSTQPNLTLATNYQDLWWAAPGGTESGWGINLAHQGDTIFATWFTYDHDHTPMWLVATAPKTAPSTYVGTLRRLAGPSFNASPFPSLGSPGGATATGIGTATFTFADGNTGIFAYTVNSVAQSKNITRQLFQPPAGTVCK
jgi:xylan 1,4-beta-xylosidase